MLGIRDVEVTTIVEVRLIKVERVAKDTEEVDDQAIDNNNQVWYMDSGSGSHMTANLEVFISFDRSAKTRIKMPDGMIRNTKGKGVIKLNSREGSCIKDVFYVPNLDSNLLSVGKFLGEAQNRSKLDENSVKCIFVGYSLETKGYRFHNPEINKLVISRNVVFDEKSTWKWNEMQINEAIIQEDDEFTNQQTMEGNGIEDGENSYPSTHDSIPNLLSSASASSSSSGTPPRKWRSLTEIYEQTERCQLVQIA
ncbi:hypothetical protein Salat_0679600 [Sesamum alatum]|uniref:Retrovirus-related Pol polyprotein from transposon TNT 1-94 n=1 Tax=Sesamum alatum TaxID=300844 RepID=A0AAE1YT18_9LAMI|nr:hypothetical protein Salat_0679600 [Sesamum alatum]